MKTWTVSDVATRAGVTVRTLHYYEEIGLLAPDHRTRSGHRRYGVRQLERLQQIKSLQALGFELDTIRETLDSPDFDPRATLREHIQQVRAQRASLRRLERTLEALSLAIDRTTEPSKLTADLLINTLEHMTMHEKYYTPEQLEQLDARFAQFSPEDIAEVGAQWEAIYDELRHHMRADTPIEAPEVQAIITRAQHLIAQFTGGDPDIRQSLNTLWEHESEPSQQHGVDPKLQDYMGRAMSVTHTP